MSKPFAVFDIDGTIFRSSLLIEVVETLISKGVFPVGANNKILAALTLWHDRSDPEAYSNYLKEVIFAFENNIRGVTEKQLAIVSDEVISRKSRETYIFTRDLIKQLKDTHVLLAISGSPEHLVERFASQYGFDDYVATKYLAEDGVFTGEAILATSKKDIILDSLIQKHELSLTGSIAVGDTKGDIDLLSAIEYPIAFNPDQELRRTAQENSWRIVIERKSQIYSLEAKDGQYQLV